MTDKLEFRIGCNQCGIVHEDWCHVGGGIIMASHPKYKKSYKHMIVANKIKCNKCGSVCFCGDGELYVLKPGASSAGMASAYKGKMGENSNSIYFHEDIDGTVMPILGRTK